MQQNLNRIKMRKNPLKKNKSSLLILPVFLISFQILPLLSPCCSVSRYMVVSWLLGHFCRPQRSRNRNICSKIIYATQFDSKFVGVDGLWEHFWSNVLRWSIIWKFNKQWFTTHNWKRSHSLICGTSLGKAEVATAMCRVEEDTGGFSTWEFSGLDTPAARGTLILPLAQLFQGLQGLLEYQGPHVSCFCGAFFCQSCLMSFMESGSCPVK